MSQAGVISSSGGGGGSSFTWNTITTNTNASKNNGYITNSGSLITVTLPTPVAAGDTVRVVGLGAGGFSVVASGADAIVSANSSYTSASSVERYNCIEFIGLAAGFWTIGSSQNNFLVA